MENEKKNKVKTIISEVVYGSITVVLVAWALVAGYHQAKTSDNILERLSNIEEKLNFEEKLSHDLEPMARYSEITDLTGTSWQLNNDWTASSGYGVFTYVGTAQYGSSEIVSGTINFGIGFQYDSSEYDWYGHSNYISWWLDDFSEYKSYVEPGDLSVSLTIDSGTNANNSVLNTNFINWLVLNATQTGGSPDEPSEPVEPTYTPLKLAQLYDMRQWFGNVDAMSGTIILSAAQTINTPLIYEIGDLEINGVHYTHLGVGYADMRGANIVVGYDFTNNTYLISTGAEYAPSAACMIGVLQVDLLTANSYTASGVQRLNMYKAPMVGGISKYETGGIIQTTGNTATSGLLLNQFKLNAITLDWSKYVPSSTKYGFLGFGSAQFTIYELLSMDLLNDSYMDFYSVGSQATGGSVFTLLGNAFSTLVPILSIQVIPGLPIGLLVCLPIVATIIVVVFKIVRK